MFVQFPMMSWVAQFTQIMPYNELNIDRMLNNRYSLILTCHLCPLYSSVFYWFLCVTYELLTYHITSDWNDMPTRENNISKSNKCDPRHKHKQEPQCSTQTLKVLYNFDAYLLMDNLMKNIVTLSMEPRKQIITLQNNYCFTWLAFYSITHRCT